MSNTQTKYHINDADQLVEANKYLLDVREPFEYEMGHIAEADNVSVNEIEERLEELPKDRKIHVYCQRGKRGASAVEILKRNGFDAVNLEEGYSAYTGKYDIADEAGETADAATENVEIDPNRVKVEASGLQCPGPLLKVNEVMGELEPGQQMEITVTDFGFCTDVEAWARKTGHSILKNEKSEDKVIVVLQKNAPQAKAEGEGHQMVETKDGATMVVFSGDMDKAWRHSSLLPVQKHGQRCHHVLHILGTECHQDPNAPKKNKAGLDKAFSMMMPKSASKLPISNMNMFGLGSKMIQYVMKKKKSTRLLK